VTVKCVVCLVAALAACSAGRGKDNDGGVDNINDVPRNRCDVRAPFGIPVPVPGVNTNGDEGGAWLSADELRIYYSLSPVPIDPLYHDLYLARRATPAEPFAMPTKLESISAARGEQPSLTADELELFFVSEGGTDIWVSTRPDVQSSFGSPMEETSVNATMTTVDDDSPWISADGATLYFASTRDGNGHELYRATRTSRDAPFSAASILFSVNSFANEMRPVVRGDALEILFASDRRQIMSSGGYTYDIYRSTRASLAEPFATPSLVAELAEPTDEVPTWISPDGCVLVFASNRPGAGFYDLWMATRR